MGLFNNLMSKIFGHASAKAAPAPAAAPASSATTAAQPASAASTTAGPSAAAAPTAGSAIVDINAVLNEMAAKHPEKLDWKKSIVDLMKLAGMDSSLAARKELAKELGYPGDTSDSASMNIWLHKQVLKKLAENGGKVPPELLD